MGVQGFSGWLSKIFTFKPAHARVLVGLLNGKSCACAGGLNVQIFDKGAEKEKLDLVDSDLGIAEVIKLFGPFCEI